MGEYYDTSYKCPICGHLFPRKQMVFSRDCHGIPYRLLCTDCCENIYNTVGYDGQYYTELDENIEEDY